MQKIIFPVYCKNNLCPCLSVSSPEMSTLYFFCCSCVCEKAHGSGKFPFAMSQRTLNPHFSQVSSKLKLQQSSCLTSRYFCFTKLFFFLPLQTSAHTQRRPPPRQSAWYLALWSRWTGLSGIDKGEDMAFWQIAPARLRLSKCINCLTNPSVRGGSVCWPHSLCCCSSPRHPLGALAPPPLSARGGSRSV